MTEYIDSLLNMMDKTEVTFWLIKYIYVTIHVEDEFQEIHHNDHVDQPFEEAKEVTQVAWYVTQL